MVAFLHNFRKDFKHRNKAHITIVEKDGKLIYYLKNISNDLQQSDPITKRRAFLYAHLDFS